MIPLRLPATILSIFLCVGAFAQEQGIEKQLSDLTEKLATQVKDHSKKKVTVLDFTDLQGGSSELGKYVAEQLTVNLVMGKRDFSILDRANLKSILAEHKLTATGLVDPENAKKLGMLAGVDTLILGNIIPGKQTISLTAKIITTDTAEIIGAGKAQFAKTAEIDQLLSHPTENKVGGATSSLTDDAPAIVKTFGDLCVELQPLQIVNGEQFLLTMTLTNRNPRKSIWVALNTDSVDKLKAVLTDSKGVQFQPDSKSMTGIPSGSQIKSFSRGHDDSQNRFHPSIEIKPQESTSGSFKFLSSDNGSIAPGVCRLQLEFLVGHDFTPNAGVGKVYNLVTKIEAR
jgi:hypothetical protein